MKSKSKLFLKAFVAICIVGVAAFATVNYFQGFEVSTGDWKASQAITRVPSSGGLLGLSSSSGRYHAELQNQPDGYQTPFGDGGYSFFGGKGQTYAGDFYQAVDVYINAEWDLPIPYPTLDAFWIDMTPHHADPNNYGAEHNFRIRATGSAVEVRVDGQTTPIATISNSGWYTFVMTWQKAAVSTDPVITDMTVYNAAHSRVGGTQVIANSPGGPMLSSDLLGNGYVWITVWQNGFSRDVLAIDNQRTGLLPWRPFPTSIEQCKNGGWQSLSQADGTAFKNQGDCIQFVNTGK